MRPDSQPKVQRLTEAWQVMLDLHRQLENAAALSIARPFPDNASPSATSDSRQQARFAPSPLLIQLGRLPEELAVKIASEAFLSPQQASQIRFREFHFGRHQADGIFVGMIEFDADDDV